MRFLNKKALSIVEYTVLLVIVISAFLIMRNYIQRGMYGSWAKSGQSYAFGRQYDPQRTIECSFDQQSNTWYDRNCYEAAYNQTCSSGDSTCEEGIMNSTCAKPTYCTQVNQALTQ